MTGYAQTLRKMGFDDQQIAGATIGGKPLAEAEPKKASNGWPSYRSKWEALYAKELEALQAAGEIREWHYEGITLKLTDPVVVDGKRRPGMRYKADFAIWCLSGRLRLVEIKGYARPKDLQRYKVARDKFRQIEFVMLKRGKGGWEVVSV